MVRCVGERFRYACMFMGSAVAFDVCLCVVVCHARDLFFFLTLTPWSLVLRTPVATECDYYISYRL